MQNSSNPLIYLGLGFLCFGFVIFMQACSSKKSFLDDNTKMEISILAELKDDTKASQITGDLSEYKFIKSSASSKSKNEVLFKVLLEGQSGEELLNKIKNHPLVLSAMIAPKGKTEAENMPGGKVTKTGPIKG